MTLPKCWWPLGVFLAVGCGESTQDRDRKKLISINNMKQIGLALLMDHDANNFFPGKNENGKPRNLSWRVSILPYLEQKALFDQFKQDEPWDGPHNQVLLAQMPRVFLDPRFQQAGATETYYQGFGGAGGILGA